MIKKYISNLFSLIILTSLSFYNEIFSETVTLNPSYSIASDWGTGYQIDVKILNNSLGAVTNWTTQFALKNQEKISSLWNGSYVQNESQIKVINSSWNGTIPVGQYATFGFVVYNAQPGSRELLNIQAFGNTNTPIPPIPLPTAPNLNVITVNPLTPRSFTISWNNVTSATSYTLQQSISSSFSNPIVVFQGNTTSYSITNQANGTFYYRVLASNPSGNSPYSNIQSVTINVPTPIPLPAAPTLNPITVNSSMPRNYTVSWLVATNAVSYMLQQSLNSNFSNPTIIAQGNIFSHSFVNQPNGTFYYRVVASNSSGNSPYSNEQSITISVPVPTTKAVVEGYWESWSNDPISAIINMKVDIINISFVTLTRTGTNSFSVNGLDTSEANLIKFVTEAHNAGKKVKIAVGGATYGLTALLQSYQDALGIAKAIAEYVQKYSLDGLDWDIEDYPAANLQIALIQNTRQLLGANSIMSYTVKTPAATTQPYNQVMQGAHQYLDYISMMAYDAYPGYSYQQDVQALIKMGIPAKKIIVGFMPGYDDIGVMTSLSQISSACQYILNNSLYGIMFWSLNRDYKNQTGLGAGAATNTSWDILH